MGRKVGREMKGDDMKSSNKYLKKAVVVVIYLFIYFQRMKWLATEASSRTKVNHIKVSLKQ